MQWNDNEIILITGPNWKNLLFQKAHLKILLENESYYYLITWHEKNMNSILRSKRHEWNPFEINVMKATYLEILIIDSKPLPQVTENHGAVFLKLEVARHVFSETIRSWNKVQMYKQWICHHPAHLQPTMCLERPTHSRPDGLRVRRELAWTRVC